MKDLTYQLAAILQHETDTNPLQTPADRIFLDIVQNRCRPKNGRRYSPETLRWAWTACEQSPACWNIVAGLDGLPLPCSRTLELHFARSGTILSQALVDRKQVGTLVAKWNESHTDTDRDRRVVLSVDAVAFRPRVTVSSEGEVSGLEDISPLESTDLFEQFLVSPTKFTSFLQKHWKNAYSSLFAFQIQPLAQHLPCCIIHAWPHFSGQGDPKTVKRLLKLRAVLEQEHNFQVVGLAFDGDSCYNDLHWAFKAQYHALLPPFWEIDMSSIVLPALGDLRRSFDGGRASELPVVQGPDLSQIVFPAEAVSRLIAIICDPKHLEKRL
jgi:hypothetical protein